MIRSYGPAWDTRARCRAAAAPTRCGRWPATSLRPCLGSSRWWCSRAGGCAASPPGLLAGIVCSAASPLRISPCPQPTLLWCFPPSFRLVPPDYSNATQTEQRSPFCEVLGVAQRRWLDGVLEASAGAAVKVIASGSVLMGSSPLGVNNASNGWTGLCSGRCGMLTVRQQPFSHLTMRCCCFCRRCRGRLGLLPPRPAGADAAAAAARGGLGRLLGRAHRWVQLDFPHFHHALCIASKWPSCFTITAMWAWCAVAANGFDQVRSGLPRR